MKTSRLRILVPATSRGAATPQAPHLLRLLGLPVVEHVLHALAPLDAVSVTLLVGRDADDPRAGAPGSTFDVLRSEGGGTSVVSAVCRLLSDVETLLVVEGDRPLLRHVTLDRLLGAHHDGGASATRLGSAACAFSAAPLLSLLTEVGYEPLPDALASLSARGLPVRTLGTDDPEELRAVQDLIDLAHVARCLRDRRAAELLAAGVLIEDPASTTVDVTVTVEPGVHVRPHTLLEGRTVVKAGATVGPFARLVDSEIGPGAQILDHCFLHECVVEAGASVGPFAHLRPETRIGARARVGNFVELKKTHLGEDSKAPHLSYLGDATIGPGVNVGAGTITCNYDGVHKHPTRIEKGAFVGSNSTLVAPVVVGEGAYVAAASVITEDVPGDALALGRARQVVKAGWAERRRKATKG
jgi:bifunctional UDP-N-acetylglucosamine pyrophosphorylase/glucosamine-1-phosphate N-acetyltransferase